MLEGRLEHFTTFSDLPEDFRRFPKTSEDCRRFSKISETCRNVCFCTLRCFFLSYPKNFQTFNKGDTNLYFRQLIDRSFFHVCY